MSPSRVVSPLLLLLLSLFSLAHADSRSDWNTLKSCRDCTIPKIYSPGWMGVDFVQYTSSPCRFIECDGNYELWVNGKRNFGMNKLMCLDGQFRPMDHLQHNKSTEVLEKNSSQAAKPIREVMCVIPEKTGYYHLNGSWLEKKNARCGVSGIYFDIGCNRNEFFSPFDSCSKAEIGEDHIICPKDHTMSIMLKSQPFALRIEKVACDGEQWKMHVIRQDKTIDEKNITIEDSTAYIRCAFYQQPPAENLHVIFVWVGTLLIIVCCGVYRLLVFYEKLESLFFWRKDDEPVGEGKMRRRQERKNKESKEL